MSEFAHQRHKPPRELLRPRELVLVCADAEQRELIANSRVAGCSGLERIICIGTAKLERKIARDSADSLLIETHRTLAPVLDSLKSNSYRLVGLEQTSNSKSLHEYQFVRRTALVIGNERSGLTDDILAMLDDVVEIPVWGLPYSYNVASAATMAMYEYCRQFPDG